jgi:hypothetical protein
MARRQAVNRLFGHPTENTSMASAWPNLLQLLSLKI